jgi:predicted ATPase
MIGEANYPMPSLSMPKKEEVSLETLTQYESVRLFSERAALALPSFSITNDNFQTVIDICRKVDGIPLAIELAAARVNILQVEEILKQLKDSFNLLANDNQTTLAHHQTIHASMDWSWRLLDHSEQTFLQQLSVFAGGWTLDAAQAVCDGDVLGLTDSLAKKSLIVVKQVTGRKTRYRFHEIVRQYVRKKLNESGEESNILNRHLKYFLDLSEQIESGFNGPKHLEWLARANDERDNIRIALQHALRVDVEAGLYISGRLQNFWDNSDHREGKHWLTEFLQKPDAKEHPSARARAQLAMGWLLAWFQQFPQSRSIAQECLDLYRERGDQLGEIDAILPHGNALHILDDREPDKKFY